MSYTGNDYSAFANAVTGSNEGSPGQPSTGVNTRIEYIRGSAERPTREQAMGMDALRRVQNLSIQMSDHVMPRPREGLAKQDFPDGTGRGRIKARMSYPGGPETHGVSKPMGHDPIDTPPFDYRSHPQGPDHPVVHHPLCGPDECRGLCGGLCSLAHEQQRHTIGSIFRTVSVGRDITSLANSPSAEKPQTDHFDFIDPEQLRQLKIKQIPFSYTNERS